MTNSTFTNICINEIVKYFNKNADKTDGKTITPENVYAVWLVKVLQNNKGLFSTTISDGMYYEITYDGDKEKLYFDAYKHWENVEISEVICQNGK